MINLAHILVEKDTDTVSHGETRANSEQTQPTKEYVAITLDSDSDDVALEMEITSPSPKRVC